MKLKYDINNIVTVITMLIMVLLRTPIDKVIMMRMILITKQICPC